MKRLRPKMFLCIVCFGNYVVIKRDLLKSIDPVCCSCRAEIRLIESIADLKKARGCVSEEDIVQTATRLFGPNLIKEE